MSIPTIEKRKLKRFIVMSQNAEMIERLRAVTPPEWEMLVVTDLYDVGDWNEVLLFRFLLLDLDETDAFDPLDVIRQIRMQFQIMIPVFCFGGDADIQDEMRMSRADRFFSRDEMVSMLPTFFEQYRWN